MGIVQLNRGLPGELVEARVRDEVTPDDLPRPESTPTTAGLPTAPMLNAPVIHTADASSADDVPTNPLRGTPRELDSLGLAPVRSAATSDSPSRVRQASFTGSVSDNE